MALSADEIMAVMTKFKELGLTSFKAEGIEIGNTPAPSPVQVGPIKPKLTQEQIEAIDVKDIVQPLSVFDELDEEDIQYWATPYFDELQEKKAKMKAARDTEIPNPKREAK